MATATGTVVRRLVHDLYWSEMQDPGPGDDGLTLRQARARYFAENGLGEDGGYSARWVKFKVGPLPLAFPNTQSRLRAVRYHDLHHVLTGYSATPLGEAEIGAWELASGCKDFAAAWVLNLLGLPLGLVLGPRRVARAFRRGRRCDNLYGEDYDALLEQTVGDTKRRLSLDRAV